MSKGRSFRAFSRRYKGLANVLSSEVSISLPFSQGVNQLKSKLINAIWDTGATCSAITKKVANDLGLIPVSKAIVSTANGSIERNVYLVDALLPNKVNVQGLRVTECSDLMGGFDILIGMDVISLGDFAITNNLGSTLMSFRIPSVSSIDFVKQANLLNVKISSKNKLTPTEIRRKKKKAESENKTYLP